MAGGTVPFEWDVAGTAKTDCAGRLEFDGGGAFPDVFENAGVNQCRID